MAAVSRRLPLYIGAGFCSFFLLAFAAYWHIYVNEVAISNVSPLTLRNVRVDLGGAILFDGTLAPGQTRKFHGEPGGEGTLNVSFDSGRKNVVRRLGYVTSGLSQRHSVIIQSVSDIEYSAQGK